ncbi:hypothetical protein [Mycobacterium sp. JS623]|uniref:hypothetical protein n=1 Tax=Mycobacterium sp. JS623 TaxID=212767 RepID=UPI0012FAD130|nr:hypothetical protein [Mycobacterium sp. JS623]
MIMDLVPLAQLAVLLALAVVLSVTAAVLVAVPVFLPVPVPFRLPVGYLRWEALAHSKTQPVPYDLCSNSWNPSAPDILSTRQGDSAPVHPYRQGSANCTIRH